MIPELRVACSICEHGAVVERYKHIIFTEGTLRAFNGVVSVQAPSTIDPGESFAVNEERLAQALAACDSDEASVTLKGDFMLLKRGKLTVKVRKLAPDQLFHDVVKTTAKKAQVKTPGLQDALRKVAPFMSADASRPWTTSILLRDGYAWATNNLSLVKYPLDLPFTCRIPSPAVPILCELPSIDWMVHEENRIVIGCGKLRVSFPEASAEWPEDLSPFFKKAPKKLPTLPKELYDAAKIVEKFAERFVALRSDKVEGKLATIECEYEIDVPDGKGAYSSKLLLLLLNHATHADFSTYPEPIFFAGEKLRGVAVGARPEEAASNG